MLTTSSRSSRFQEVDCPAHDVRPDKPRDSFRSPGLRVSRLQFCLVTRWLRIWYALKIAGRSFRGHMRILLAKKYWAVDLGPLFQPLPDGCFDENSRTRSRRLGIEAIKQSHPWANTVDLEIFLQGFDWGERYALDIGGIQPSSGVGEALESPSHSQT